MAGRKSADYKFNFDLPCLGLSGLLLFFGGVLGLLHPLAGLYLWTFGLAWFLAAPIVAVIHVLREIRDDQRDRA